VIGFLNASSAETNVERLRAFHLGLKETGYVEGKQPLPYHVYRSVRRAPPIAERDWGQVNEQGVAVTPMTPRATPDPGTFALRHLVQHSLSGDWIENCTTRVLFDGPFRMNRSIAMSPPDRDAAANRAR
jgi:hypothetical protein